MVNISSKAVIIFCSFLCIGLTGSCSPLSSESAPEYRPLYEEDYPEIPYKRGGGWSYEWDLIKENNKGHLILTNMANRKYIRRLSALINIEEFANKLRKEYAERVSADKLLLDYGAQLRAATTVQVDSIPRDLGYCWATSQIEKVQPKKSIENIYPLTERFLNSKYYYKEEYDNGSALGISWDARNFAAGGYQALQDAPSLRKHNWNYSCAERYGYGESQDFGDLPLHIKFDSNNIATITGEINETFAEELERSLSRREAPELKAIKINSYGGYVYSAMEAGQFIRE